MDTFRTSTISPRILEPASAMRSEAQRTCTPLSLRRLRQIDRCFCGEARNDDSDKERIVDTSRTLRPTRIVPSDCKLMIYNGGSDARWKPDVCGPAVVSVSALIIRKPCCH
jgi:hypothetical protein